METYQLEQMHCHEEDRVRDFCWVQSSRLWGIGLQCGGPAFIERDVKACVGVRTSADGNPKCIRSNSN